MKRESKTRGKRGRQYEPLAMSHLVKCQIVGRTIRDLREKADLTQEQLAEAVGVSRALVSAWERGQRSFYIHQFNAFCHALDLSAADFLEPYSRALEAEAKRTGRAPTRMGYI